MLPGPCLKIHRSRYAWHTRELTADLCFDYDGTIVDSHAPGHACFDSGRRRRIRRDEAAEEAARAHMLAEGFTAQDDFGGRVRWQLPPRSWAQPRAACSRWAGGSRWKAGSSDAADRSRSASAPVSTGSNFAGDGFEGRKASFPRLLAALKKASRPSSSTTAPWDSSR